MSNRGMTVCTHTSLVRFGILIGCLLSLLGINHFSAVAQTATPDEFEPIFGGGIYNAEWSRDSQIFMFSPHEPDWFIFNIPTWNLTKSNEWPPLSLLTTN